MLQSVLIDFDFRLLFEPVKEHAPALYKRPEQVAWHLNLALAYESLSEPRASIMIKSRTEAQNDMGTGRYMNTFLSDEDLSFQRECSQFAKEFLAPLAKSLETGKAASKDVLKKIAESGLLAASVPKQYGGKGGPFLHAALLTEALGTYEAGVAAMVASHLSVSEFINEYGSDSQKSQFLPMLARGETLATVAYLEDERQVLPAEVLCREKQDGGALYLQGTKRFVLNAEAAGMLVVLAQNLTGNSQFWLIDKVAAAQVKFEAETSIGLNTARPAQITLNKLAAEEKSKIALDENRSIEQQFDFILSVVRTLLASACIGMVEGELASAAEFARTALRHGEPLANSQAVQWKLADHATEGSAARLLTYRAAWSKGEQPQTFVQNASMCKFYASKVARTYSGETIQILGISHTGADTNFARLYGDAKMIELLAGSSEEQKALISRELKL